MIDSIFRSLLWCEHCRHSVELHDGNGCNITPCACPFNRAVVIEKNIEIALAEHAAASSTWKRVSE